MVVSPRSGHQKRKLPSLAQLSASVLSEYVDYSHNAEAEFVDALVNTQLLSIDWSDRCFMCCMLKFPSKEKIVMCSDKTPCLVRICSECEAAPQRTLTDSPFFSFFRKKKEHGVLTKMDNLRKNAATINTWEFANGVGKDNTCEAELVGKYECSKSAIINDVLPLSRSDAIVFASFQIAVDFQGKVSKDSMFASLPVFWSSKNAVPQAELSVHVNKVEHHMQRQSKKNILTVLKGQRLHKTAADGTLCGKIQSTLWLYNKGHRCGESGQRQQDLALCVGSSLRAGFGFRKQNVVGVLELYSPPRSCQSAQSHSNL